MMQILLASRSPRRREILEEFGFQVTVHVPNVEEMTLGQNGCDSPEKMVMHNAKLKAESVSGYSGWILASDTTVFFNEREYAKPVDRDEAIRFLTELSGNTHEVYSSFCLRKEEVEHLGFDVARVTFKKLPLKEIEKYVDTVPVLDKAGAYAIQASKGILLEKLEGSVYTVMGLPIEKILKIL
jgi:septum formation protein